MREQNRLMRQTPQSEITDASESQVYQCTITNCPELIRLPEDGILVAWLHAKTGRSQSWKTVI